VQVTFPGFLLGNHRDPETKAEPKRNINCVAENDFSPKMLQIGYE
jgi:hypothetical protein